LKRQKIFSFDVKMVGILRKMLQVLKSIRGPALKYFTPVLDAVMPGLGSVANVVATEGLDRASDTWDAYESAKESGQSFGVRDAFRTFTAPRAAAKPAPLLGAVQTKSSDYGGIHPRLQLKSGDDDE
jgi:hypothetical protein